MSSKRKQPIRQKVTRPNPKADDFVSVARRLGADEDKARFEKKLGKIAKAKVAVPSGRVK